MANRELGTIKAITAGTMKVTLDSGRSVGFHLSEYRHVDYGYAVTSHCSQGQTADRVLLHIDTDRAGEGLVNQRLAYVAISRGRHDAQIFTNDKAQLVNASIEMSPIARPSSRRHSKVEARTMPDEYGERDQNRKPTAIPFLNAPRGALSRQGTAHTAVG